MRFFIPTLLLFLLGCAAPEAPPVDADPLPATVPSLEALNARVADAEARLQATEAGRRVWQALDAHGGLGRWYRNGPLRFRHAYQRASGGTPLRTDEVIDTWSARARHAFLPDSTLEIGWTGEVAWHHPPEAEPPVNARFWALTPYYFVAMPFVLADPGVNLAEAGQMTAEGKTYDLIHVTFDAGTGDAPDDYYYLLLDPATHRVGGVRYVVSYPGFYEGGTHSAERLMLYDGAQTVGGITLQEGFRSFAWTDAGAGAAAARGTLTHVAFLPGTPNDYFAPPAGAAIQEGL